MENISRVFISVLFSVLIISETSAQTFDEYKRQQQAKYNNYVQQKTEEYRAYRDRVNAEYADYMRKAWTREEAQPAQAMPKRPEPPKPVVRNPMDMPKFGAIPFGEVRDLKLPDVPKPEPIIPIDELEQLVISVPEPVKPNDNPNENLNPNGNGNDNGKSNEPKPEPKPKPKEEQKPKEEVKQEGLTFKWCGQTWQVPLEKQHSFRLKSTSEADVADAWKTLSGVKYAGVIAACLKIRNVHQLPDWGYLRFLDAMAEAFLPGMQSEARLLEMFILVQSGYQVRIARSEGRLFLLVPSNGEIYGYSFLRIGGRKFYVTDKREKTGSFHVFERDFPREQPFVWHIRKLPIFSSGIVTRTLQSKRNPEMRTTVGISKGLVEFMNGYPKCNDWNLYALASLSKEAKDGLYPVLRQRIEGKDRTDALETLLSFVQTAFDYKTDGEQFGEERPLFGDETLYYPYCDCEDRAILFSILVRELLSMDVVLLNYPEHLATAVRMDGEVKGDYFELDGHRYVVCDPTYIGAHVGESMPDYKDAVATIVRI